MGGRMRGFCSACSYCTHRHECTSFSHWDIVWSPMLFFVFFQLLKSEMQSNRVLVTNAKNNSLIVLGYGISYIQQSAQFRRHTLVEPHTQSSFSDTIHLMPVVRRKRFHGFPSLIKRFDYRLSYIVHVQSWTSISVDD